MTGWAPGSRAPALEASDWLRVRDDSDVVLLRRWVRLVAEEQGLPTAAAEALATAATEIGSNLVLHAGGGVMRIDAESSDGRPGVLVVAHDDGPGIADLELAQEDGYSSGGGLGLGLSSARRLVDDFAIESTPGRGTWVLLRKWMP